MIKLSHPTKKLNGEITISGSKSESNRWLILQKLYPEIIEIQNISNSEDTQILKASLETVIQSGQTVIDVGHAGTAMRFLTAYFAVQSGSEVVLTGSERMKQRPIGALVETLNALGCDVKYVEKQGFPPLKITGKEIQKDEISVKADISSQFITALMLIAPKLPNGLGIHFEGEITSKPYIEMTKAQLEQLGAKVEWKDNGIQIYPLEKSLLTQVSVESDWSSASYWFSMAALAKNSEITLKHFKPQSYQGDRQLTTIFDKYFGVESRFQKETLMLSKKKNFNFPDFVELDLNATPDIAQTIAVTCAGLGIKARLTGLKTLQIKETNRLEALRNELVKIGCSADYDEDSLTLKSFDLIDEIPVIQTYQDHRMAMSFAPLALLYPVKIEDENVVTKSYPDFWKDLEKTGFKITS